MRNLLITAAVVGIGGYFGAKLYIQHKAAQDLDAMLTQVRPFADVEYDGVVATMAGELKVEGVTIRMPRFDDAIEIESIGLQTPGFLFLLGFDKRSIEFPEQLGVVLDGIRVDADADFMRTLDDFQTASAAAPLDLTAADRCATSYGFTPGMLKRLGYYEVVADLRLSYRRAGNQVVMSFGVDVENMYDVDVEFTLEGIQDPTALAQGARPLFVGGRIDYVDRSLNGRIMKHCAEQQVAPEDVIAAQLRELQAFARESGVELDAPLIEPYTDFLQGKQRFTLISAPHNPVDLTRVSLYKPSDVPNLLNLTAEAG